MRGVEWILRAEAAAIFAVGAWLAFLVSPSPWLVLPVSPIVLLVVGWMFVAVPLVLAGAILLAHVGMDRALGYGLKLPTDFRDTHLGRIGR